MKTQYFNIVEKFLQSFPIPTGPDWRVATEEDIALVNTPLVPQMVSRAQGKAALIQAGLWDTVVAYVDGIADPVEKALAEVALNDTSDWQRNSPFLNEAAAALGLSQEDVDALFLAARDIVL